MQSWIKPRRWLDAEVGVGDGGEADKKRGGERQERERVFAVSRSLCERRDHERCFSCFYIHKLTFSPIFILLVST